MRWGEFHYGVDLAAPYGTPYLRRRTPARSSWPAVRRLRQRHRRSTTAAASRPIYGHASRLAVTEGQHVKAGDLLGYVGSTGYSTGNHLHYEIHVNGTPTDPIDFMLRPRGGHPQAARSGQRRHRHHVTGAPRTDSLRSSPPGTGQGQRRAH